MKKIYKKEEGVSPVIATILMVAITVVLAATVYVMVAGIGTGGTNKLVANLTYDQVKSDPKNGDVYINVAMSNPSSADWGKVTIVVTLSDGTTGKVTLSSNSGSITLGSSTATVTVMDLDGSTSLSDGDVLHISGSGIDFSGATISLSISGYSGSSSVTVPS